MKSVQGGIGSIHGVSRSLVWNYARGIGYKRVPRLTFKDGGSATVGGNFGGLMLTKRHTPTGKALACRRSKLVRYISVQDKVLIRDSRYVKTNS